MTISVMTADERGRAATDLIGDGASGSELGHRVLTPAEPSAGPREAGPLKSGSDWVAQATFGRSGG